MCVGRRNYVVFIIFLVSTFLSLVWSLMVKLYIVVDYVINVSTQGTAFDDRVRQIFGPVPGYVFIIVAACSFLAYLVATGSIAQLLQFHVKLIMRNKTTYQYIMEQRRNAANHTVTKKRTCHPRDLLCLRRKNRVSAEVNTSDNPPSFALSTSRSFFVTKQSDYSRRMKSQMSTARTHMPDKSHDGTEFGDQHTSRSDLSYSTTSEQVPPSTPIRQDYAFQQLQTSVSDDLELVSQHDHSQQVIGSENTSNRELAIGQPQDPRSSAWQQQFETTSARRPHSAIPEQQPQNSISLIDTTIENGGLGQERPMGRHAKGRHPRRWSIAQFERGLGAGVSKRRPKLPPLPPHAFQHYRIVKDERLHQDKNPKPLTAAHPDRKSVV